MATATLDILVQLRDEASSALKDVSGNLQDMQKSLEPAAEASKAFAIGLAAVGAAGLAAGTYAVNQARDAAAAQKQLQAVLTSTHGVAGMTADAVNALAEKMQTLTNYDNDAVVSAENMLLTFTNIGKDIFPQAAVTVLDLATAMKVDAKDAAIQLGKALNDPATGITALTRVGVTFTDQQKQMIKTLTETGQTAEAQKIVLAELAREFGGSAQAVASPLAQMKNALDDVAKTIGFDLLPAVNEMAKAVTAFAVDVLPVWIDRAKAFIDLLQRHPAVLYAVAGAITGALLPAVISFGTTLLTVTVPALAAAALALAPWIIGGAVVGGIIAGIVWLAENWKTLWNDIAAFVTPIMQQIESVLTGTWNAIKGVAADVWGAIKTVVVDVVDFIVGAIVIDLDALDPQWREHWNALVTFLKSAWDGIKNMVRDAMAAMSGFIMPVLTAIANAWNAAWGGMSSFFGGIWDGIKTALQSAIDWIVGKLNALVSTVSSIAGTITGPISSVANMLGSAASSAANLAKSAVGSITATGAGITKLASGGIVTQPTFALVGEAGPEAVIPLSRFASGGTMQGGGNITVNINGSVYSGKEAALEMANEIARVLRYNQRI